MIDVTISASPNPAGAFSLAPAGLPSRVVDYGPAPYDVRRYCPEPDYDPEGSLLWGEVCRTHRTDGPHAAALTLWTWASRDSAPQPCTVERWQRAVDLIYGHWRVAGLPSKIDGLTSRYDLYAAAREKEPERFGPTRYAPGKPGQRSTLEQRVADQVCMFGLGVTVRPLVKACGMRQNAVRQELNRLKGIALGYNPHGWTLPTLD